MLIKYLLLIAAFVFLTGNVTAKNCPECPKGEADYQHCFWLKINEWGSFHCDQIRQLRIRVEDLESALDQQKQYVIECDTILENKVSDKEKNLWEEINFLKEIVRYQSERIEELERQLGY